MFVLFNHCSIVEIKRAFQKSKWIMTLFPSFTISSLEYTSILNSQKSNYILSSVVNKIILIVVGEVENEIFKELATRSSSQLRYTCLDSNGISLLFVLDFAI